MTVQRNSDPYSVQAKDTRRVSQATIAAGNVRPDTVVQVGDASAWRQNLIGNLTGLVNQVASKAVDLDTQEQFLNGVAAAERGEVEDNLQGNPLTRDWAVAGHRSTMVQMKLADQKAQLAQDMSWLRERSPEEFQNYIGSQRAEALPAINSLPLEMRNNIVPQFALSERAAVSAHGVAHAGFIREEIMSTQSAKFNGAANSLDAARELGDPNAYQRAVEDTAGHVFGMWASSNLREEDKTQMTQEFFEHLLAGKHISAVDYLRNTQMPDAIDADGKPVLKGGYPTTVFSRLPMKNQEKIGAAYYKAREATNAIANTDFMQRYALEEAAMTDGTSTLDFEQVSQFANTALKLNIIKPDGYMSLITKWARGRQKQDASIGGAQAYFNNDSGYLIKNGIQMKDARDAARAVLSQMPLPEAITKLSTAGDRKNMDAYKLIGEFSNASVAALADPTGKMSVEHGAVVSQLHSLLDSYEANDNPLGATNLLAGLTPENSLRLQRLRMLNAEHVTGQEAVNRLLKMENEETKMTPQDRAVRAGITKKADMEYIDSIGDMGWAGAMAKRIGSFLPFVGDTVEGASTKLAFEGRSKVLATTSTTDKQAVEVRGHYLGEIRSAVAAEFSDMDIAGLNLPKEARLERAQANVMRRLVETPHGALILPKGKTVQTYFGVDASVPAESVAEAIGRTMVPQTDKGRFTMTAMFNKVAITEYDRNGVEVPGSKRELDPRSIRAEVMKKQEAADRETLLRVGSGVEYSKDGIQFRYNGENAAGANPKDMLEFRNALVKHEGVRNVEYDDASNATRTDGKKVKTVGVGISTTNPQYYPKADASGKVSNGAIAESFRGASNAAAIQAVSMQDKLGLTGNSDAFKLLAELSYQGLGNSGKFLAALKAKDAEAATAALKTTRAYELAHGERRKHYENLTTKILKG